MSWSKVLSVAVIAGAAWAGARYGASAPAAPEAPDVLGLPAPVRALPLPPSLVVPPANGGSHTSLERIAIVRQLSIMQNIACPDTPGVFFSQLYTSDVLRQAKEKPGFDPVAYEAIHKAQFRMTQQGVGYDRLCDVLAKQMPGLRLLDPRG